MVVKPTAERDAYNRKMDRIVEEQIRRQAGKLPDGPPLPNGMLTMADLDRILKEMGLEE